MTSMHYWGDRHLSLHACYCRDLPIPPNVDVIKVYPPVREMEGRANSTAQMLAPYVEHRAWIKKIKRREREKREIFLKRDCWETPLFLRHGAPSPTNLTKLKPFEHTV